MWEAEKWSFARQAPGDEPRGMFPMHMDDRHVRFLYDLLMTGSVSSVLEIGCWRGFSSSALIQAVNDGADCRVTLCDINPQPQLRVVMDSCLFPERVSLQKMDSLSAIRPEYNLVIVDGNHALVQVSRELGLLLYHQTVNIVAHDISPHLNNCRGSMYLSTALQSHQEYCCLSDVKDRVGERTDRGLLFATRSERIYERVKPLWNQMTEE